MESESLSLDPDFIEDVGKRLEKEGITDVNEMINRLNKRYTLIRNAEHTTLQQRQRLQTKEKYLKDTLSCVRMLLQRREKDEDTIVDYGLSGAYFARNPGLTPGHARPPRMHSAAPRKITTIPAQSDRTRKT